MDRIYSTVSLDIMNRGTFSCVFSILPSPFALMSTQRDAGLI